MYEKKHAPDLPDVLIMDLWKDSGENSNEKNTIVENLRVVKVSFQRLKIIFTTIVMVVINII